MKHPWLELAAVWGMFALTGCSSELTSSSTVPVSMGPAGVWPDTLVVDEDSLVEVRITLKGGTSVEAATVQWTSSDPTIVSVIPLLPVGTTPADSSAAALHARVRALRRGLASITISLPDSLGLRASDTTLTIAVLEHWIAVSAGRDYGCALTSHHAAYCWGALGHGSALGSGSLSGSEGPVPVVNVLPDQQYSSISASTDGAQYDALGFNTFAGFTCGILGGSGPGVTFCWGGGSLIPEVLSGGRAFTDVSVGGRRACANDRTVPFLKRFDDPFLTSTYCWTNVSAPVPVPLPIPGFVYDDNQINFVLDTVAVGYDHACGLWNAGDITFCWGSGLSGQLGDGAGVSSDTLVEVAANLRFVKISAGQSHTCGLTDTRDIYCWGGNVDGELGVPSAPGNGDHYLVPVQANAGGLKFMDVSAGGSVGNVDVLEDTGQTCAIGMDSLAYCWGHNRYGELGIDPNVDDGCTSGYACADHPRPVIGSLHFVAISTAATKPFAYGLSTTHTCALTGRGQVYCWGSSWDGQLGNPIGGIANRPGRIAEPE